MSALGVDIFVLAYNCAVNTPFTRSSKQIIEQTFSKCIQNTRARRVLLLFDVCLMIA